MSQLTAEPPPELAPSETRAEAPTVSRVIGAVGLFCLTAGVVSIIAAQYGRGLFGEGAGYLLAAIGVTGLLIHAARDADLEIRRLYGGLAAALLITAVVVSIVPGKPPGTEASRVGYYLMPWGAGAGLASLLFFIPFVRHETEEPYRTATRYLLLGVGALMAVGAVAAGCVWPNFLVGPGLFIALLGLGFVAAYLANEGTSEGLGFQVAVGLGVLGGVAILIALGRSIAPTVLSEGSAALKNARQQYDVWRILFRVFLILLPLGLAAWAARSRSVPLWLKAGFAAVALAFSALFVVGSVSGPLTDVPAQPFLVPYGLILMGIGAVYVAVSLGACSDNVLVTLTRRELAAYFYSPIAYVVLLGMAAASWVGYWVFLENLYEQRRTFEPIVQGYWGLTVGAAFGVVFLVPVLTMRAFSEEKRTGTLEVLLTAPVDELPVVLSKFIAGLLFFMLSWVPAGLYLLSLRVEGGQPFDYRPLLSYYLALAACGAGFVAMGLFFSSLTRNQIIAAALTFAGMFIMLLTLIVRQSERIGPALRATVGRLDFFTLWQQALAGQLMVTDVLVHLSLAVFWLFLTVKVLEARKWS